MHSFLEVQAREAIQKNHTGKQRKQTKKVRFELEASPSLSTYMQNTEAVIFRWRHVSWDQSTSVWRAVCVKIIALPIWIWIKFYPCPHRPDARRLCQNYSTIHVDMDKIGFIHIHTDEIPAVCVKIIAFTDLDMDNILSMSTSPRSSPVVSS